MSRSPRFPPDWEPLGQADGWLRPYGIQIRQRSLSDQTLLQWQVRLTARPKEVFVGIPDSNNLCNLSDVRDIKRAIAYSLMALMPKNFDEEKDPIPFTPPFRFRAPPPGASFGLKSN